MINGENIRKKGHDIISSVVDALIHPQIQAECTWSGKTNVSSKKKLAFSQFKEIIGVIHFTCRRADSNYSLKDCEENLIYKILKHAVKRW